MYAGVNLILLFNANSSYKNNDGCREGVRKGVQKNNQVRRFLVPVPRSSTPISVTLICRPRINSPVNSVSFSRNTKMRIVVGISRHHAGIKPRNMKDTPSRAREVFNIRNGF